MGPAVNTLDLAEQARIKTAACFVEARPTEYREGFKEWLEGNPRLWFEFERRADMLWRRGRKHFGAKAIWESIRFDTAMAEEETDDSKYRLNNSWTSSLARLYLAHHPDRREFFETRERRAA